MSRAFGVLGAVFGFIALGAGPIGAHHLHLARDMQEAFETGVRYQLIHAVALLVVAVMFERGGSALLALSGWLFVAGQVLFPFGLYVFAATENHSWALATPVGGVCYLAGWASLAAVFARRRGDAGS
jgi:uncharacterized membrane protein YgdD (TMEM256/DUF423 family)